MSASTPAPQTLFRTPALQARYQVVDGPLRLRAAGLHVLALVLLAGTATAATLVARQPYTEKLSVTGFAQRAAGRLAVRAPVAGLVSEVAVSDGQQVAKGQTLYRLNTDLSLVDGRSAASARLQAITQEAQALQHSNTLARQRYRHDLQQLNAQLAESAQRRTHLQQELRAARAQQRLDSERLLDMERLLARGAVAVAERDTAQRQRLASERLQLSSARALAEHDSTSRQQHGQRRLLQQQFDQTTADLRAAQARLQQRRIDAQLAGARQVRAPLAGVVGGLNIRPGQRLAAGQLALNLLSLQSSAQVLLLLPSEAMGSVAIGQSVRLRYSGYPYQKFGMPKGQITQLSDTPVTGSELDLPVNPSASVYLAHVRVAADAAQTAARDEDSATFDPAAVAPGMQLEADVVVRQDPIWRRALEPLLRLWQRA